MAIFVLDYSGSMEQKVNNVEKSKLLREGMVEFFKSIPPNQPSIGIIFGAQPKLGCKDIIKNKTDSRRVGAWILSKKPGPYGKTPLADSLLALKEYKDNTELWDSPALVITDGADSCDKDPCKALVELDKSIRVSEKVHLKVIGFDLKQQKKNLECFKKLVGKLDNFDLEVIEADDMHSFLKALARSSRAAKLPKGMVSIYVSGAPPNAEFVALPAERRNQKTDWKGTFRVVVKPDSWKISLKKTIGSQPVHIDANPGDYVRIYYSDFFKVKTAMAHVKCEGLAILAEPVELTKQAHKEVKSIPICDGNQPIQIPFGKWKLSAISPWWLKDSVSTLIDLNPNEKLKLSGESIFKESLDWITVDSVDSTKVLKLGEAKIVLLPGIKKVPKKKETQEEWILK